jgi:hypothetical protein
MTQKKVNYICLAISLLPFIVALFLVPWMIQYPSTHLVDSNAGNASAVDKMTFVFLTLFSGLGFYYLSLQLVKYLPLISTKFNVVYVRFFINSALTLLVFILIIKNTK